MPRLKPKFYGKKVGGQFVLNNQDQEYFEGYMGNFEEDSEMEATFAKKYKKELPANLMKKQITTDTTGASL